MKTGTTMLMAAEVIGFIGFVEHNPRVIMSQPVFHLVLELLNEQWLAMPQGPIFRRPRRRATLEWRL